jgi:hypothetical protein
MPLARAGQIGAVVVAQSLAFAVIFAKPFRFATMFAY